MKLAARLLFFAAAMLLEAQEDATFTSDVKVVNLLATVHDKKGAIIRDLTKDDFTILENGRPQSIRYFARQSDLPITIGLMIDTSMSQERVLDAERGASFRFIDRVLRENKDRVFLMQFDLTVQMRQGLTNSRKKLDDALPFVDTPTRRELQNQSGGGTLLYDAVVKAANETMKDLTGRKALIVLSDGDDFGSEATLSDATEAALRADTLVYSILFSDRGSSHGRNALMKMSKETGAGFFEVTKKLNIERIFDLIQEELRSQYSIGYVSDQPVVISEFRRIDLIAKQKEMVVQSRKRYWARP